MLKKFNSKKHNIFTLYNRKEKQRVEEYSGIGCCFIHKN